MRPRPATTSATPHPVATGTPFCSSSVAIARATCAKSTIPVAGGGHPAPPAPLELIQPSDLALVAGDDHLAAPLVRDCMLFAIRVHLARARDAQASLERAWGVVDAGVNDAAVGAGLAPGHALTALEHRGSQVRAPARELAGDRQTEDACADDNEIALAG